MSSLLRKCGIRLYVLTTRLGPLLRSKVFTPSNVRGKNAVLTVAPRRTSLFMNELRKGGRQRDRPGGREGERKGISYLRQSSWARAVRDRLSHQFTSRRGLEFSLLPKKRREETPNAAPTSPAMLSLNLHRSNVAVSPPSSNSVRAS